MSCMQKSRCPSLLVLMFTCGSAAAGQQDVRLVNAMKSRDLDAVRALAKSEIDVNVAQHDGATALHWAAYWDEITAAELLIGAGAHVDAANDYGVTPLSLASTNGSAQMIELLLTAGASPNGVLPSGETVLMTAAYSGSVEGVKSLIARGADVNARENVMGQTALMWALSQEHMNIVPMLIDAGADVRAKSKSGFSPLLFAARQGNTNAVRLLLSKGTDVNEAAKDGASVLHVAVLRGHVELATYLLDQGANPNADGPGYTPLHWAAGIWETVHSHDYTLNPNAVNTVTEWSALAGVPTQEAKHDLIKALLAQGAYINARIVTSPPRFGFSLFNRNYVVGATPFFLASMVADVPTMRLLLANGADPTLAAKDNAPPLLAAAGLARLDAESRVSEASRVEALQMAIELGADIQAANDLGNTALHAATMAGLNDVVQFLVDKGANVNAKNKRGETPLKLANGYELNLMVYTRPSTAALLRKLGASE